MTILKLNVMNLTIESCIQHINIIVLGYKYRIRPVCGAEDEKWGVVGNRFGLGGDIQLGQPARSRRSQLQSQRIRLFRYRIDFRFVVARFRFSAPAFFEQHWTQIQPHYNCCDGDCTIRYDTICYFNVQSKVDMSQLNLPHGTDNKKVENRETEK